MAIQPDPSRTITAPRGTTLNARNWLTEAPLRMLMNNLDPAVAEHPEQLIVYGGAGKAARNWECFEAIVATLKRLGDDETLLIQSGKPRRGRQHPPRRTTCSHRQCQPRPALGHLGTFPRTRPQGTDHVRPDDRRLVDLHRLPGHYPGHL